MDAVLLARAQFAANMSFHILFPTISIALGWMLLFFRWRWLRTKADAWLAKSPRSDTTESSEACVSWDTGASV